MASPISDHTVPWPEPFARRYRAAGYWTGEPLGHRLRAVADRIPDHPALTDATDGTRLTHAELADRADVAATRLHGLGLSRGDRIVVQLANGWPFVVLTLACLRAGIVPVMALPAHRETELTHLAATAEAAAIAVPDTLREFDHQALAHHLGSVVGQPWHVLVSGKATGASVSLEQLCGPGGDPAAAHAALDGDPPDAASVAVFLLSGGTTGLPKLIARTHDDYGYNATASAAVADVRAGDRYLVALPAGHNFSLACPGILGALLAGGTVVTLASPRPEGAFAAIAAEGVTHTAVVPAVAARWLDHATETATGPGAGPGVEQLASLRVLQVGGARIADELAGRVGPVLGARLQQVFGMAEGLLNYTRLDDPDEVVRCTQGRPVCTDDEVRIVDEDDNDLPDGEPGILLTRGPYTPRGYYNAPEHNARAFTPDGWYRSGDVCRRRPDGNLVVEGRDKDMINRGGEKVSAEEVENLVYRLPAAEQVAAVAMPDTDLGERVCVYVVPRAGNSLTLDQIHDVMHSAGIARFKIPEHLVTVAELPTTKVGKIDKKALREDITRRLAAKAP